MPTVFGLEPDDLVKKICPKADEESFSIGADGDLTEADAQAIIDTAEDLVLARLPERYRQLCRAVDGEVLVQYASGGEASATVGLFPIVSGSLVVWRNFPKSLRWRERIPPLALPAEQYSANLTTGVITLSAALSPGETLWAEYRHTGAARLLVLRDMALTLAAVETSRRVGFFKEGEGIEAFREWETTTYANLNRIVSVDYLDNLNLVRETDQDKFYDSILNTPTRCRPIGFPHRNC